MIWKIWKDLEDFSAKPTGRNVLRTDVLMSRQASKSYKS